MDFTLTWNRCASGEWISTVSGHATTDGTMVHDYAFGVQAARTRTRVCAFVVFARELRRTFGTSYAFWSASRRGAYISWQA